MKILRPLSKQPIPTEAKKVFNGVIFEVYQWEQQLFDGSREIFEKIKRPDTVIVIPIIKDGRIIIAEQEQPGKVPFVGTISGMIDEGEDPLDAARRELLEESGYEAREFELWHSFQPISKIEWAIYVFVARNCEEVREQNLDAGERIKIKLVGFEDFLKVVLDKNYHDMEIKIKFMEAKNDPNKMAAIKKLFFGNYDDA